MDAPGRERDRSDCYDEDREKHTAWIAFPYRSVLYVLAILTAIFLVGFITVGGFLGAQAYRRLVFPHQAVHASKATIKDGSRVVKPYYSPAKYGGVTDRATLVMTVWFREGVTLAPPPRGIAEYWDWREERDEEDYSRLGRGEQGYIRPEKGLQNEWEVVWKGDIKDNILQESY
jgi:hypothetical protein